MKRYPPPPRRYLAEGILPTTNEISILKYSDTAPATSNPSQVSYSYSWGG